MDITRGDIVNIIAALQVVTYDEREPQRYRDSYLETLVKIQSLQVWLDQHRPSNTQ